MPERKNPSKSDRPSTTPGGGQATRIPPQNLEAEVSVLGGLLLDPEAILRVADNLHADDFYRPEHAMVYDAMLALFERRVPTDLVTVSEELSRRKQLDAVGGQAMLSSLVSAVATASNITHYAQIVREKSLLRRLITASSKIGELAFEEDRDSDGILDEAESTLFGVTQRFMTQNFISIRSVLDDSFERLGMLAKQDGSLRGLPSGFKGLDRLLGGLQRSDLIIIAARPSMGKTTYALNIAEHLAVREGKTVGIFSLEMSKEQLVDKLMSSIGRVDSWKLRSGQLNEHEMANLIDAQAQLAEAKLFIDDKGMASVMEVRAKARRLQAEHGLDLLMIDYLQLMTGSTTKGTDNRVQEVSEISRSLKALAKELNCPVLALSQLSRAVEARNDKRPMLSDLRESGCLAGDTLITRRDTGERVPIRELVGQTDIPVWSLDEHLKLVPATMSKVFSSGYKQTFELEFRSGRRIKASANHPFRTYTNWLRLDQLEIGQRLALPRGLASNKTANSSYPDALLIFLAHMVGDGCYVPHQPIHYTSADLENVVAIENAAITLWGITPRRVKQGNWYHVYLPSPYRLARTRHHPFVQWLSENHLTLARSYEKHLPESLFSCSDAQIRLFLRHLWATDGCVHVGEKMAALYYATTSGALAEQVQHLLLRCGVQSTIHRIPQRKAGRFFRDSYHITIQGKEDQQQFLQDIGCAGARGRLIPQALARLASQKANPNRGTFDASIWKTLVAPARKNAQLTERAFQAGLGGSYSGSSLYQAGLSRERLGRVATLTHDAGLQNLATSDIYWDELIAVRPCLVEEVFDATVPEHHNFLANDIIVHNSIEQDADVVMFIFREDYYNKNQEEHNHLVDIIVSKHRNGPTGDVKLSSQFQFSRFYDLDTRH